MQKCVISYILYSVHVIFIWMAVSIQTVSNKMSLKLNGCGKMVRKDEKQISYNSQRKNKQILVYYIIFKKTIFCSMLLKLALSFLVIFSHSSNPYSLIVSKKWPLANVLENLFLISNKIKAKFTIFQIC